MHAPALLFRWISSFLRDMTVKVRILGHTSTEIAINYGVPQGSPISPLLFLLYMSKLPKLLPNTRRSLFTDDFMIYSESSIIRSDLIQSNLQTSMDDTTLFISDYLIILSCTKSVRVLFERKKGNRLKTSSVLPLTLLNTFRSHFRTVAALALRLLLKMNSIFSSTYGHYLLTSSVLCLLTVRQLHE